MESRWFKRARDGSEQAAYATGFRKAAAPLGGIAYFRVDLAQPTHGQGDYERLCSAGEAFILVAMTRLMVRRLARPWVFSDGLRRSVLGSSKLAMRLATSW
jgi:hypothetical protein